MCFRMKGMNTNIKAEAELMPIYIKSRVNTLI